MQFRVLFRLNRGEKILFRKTGVLPLGPILNSINTSNRQTPTSCRSKAVVLKFNDCSVYRKTQAAIPNFQKDLAFQRMVENDQLQVKILTVSADLRPSTYCHIQPLKFGLLQIHHHLRPGTSRNINRVPQRRGVRQFSGDRNRAGCLPPGRGRKR